MSILIVPPLGGGGISSDELTATRAEVLEGKTAITADSGDEAGIGTMLSDANISSTGQLLEGVAAYGRYGAKYVGTALSDASISNASQLSSGIVAYGRNGTRYVGNVENMNGGTYTPSPHTQTIACAGKKVLENIVINPIPDVYVNIGGSGGTWYPFSNGVFADGWAVTPKYWNIPAKEYDAGYNVNMQTFTDEGGVSRNCFTTRPNGERTTAVFLNRAIDLTNISRISAYWYQVWPANRYAYYYIYLLDINKNLVTSTYDEEMSWETSKTHYFYRWVSMDVSSYSGLHFVGFNSTPYTAGIGEVRLTRK